MTLTFPFRDANGVLLPGTAALASDKRKPKSGNENAGKLVQQFNEQTDKALAGAEYVIIHIVLWKQGSQSTQKPGGQKQAEQGAAESKYRIASEHWYLYRNDELVKKKSGNPPWGGEQVFGARIFGSRKIGVLLIHVGEGTLDEKKNLTPDGNDPNHDAVNPVGDSIRNWDIEYTVSVKAKTPTNVQNLLDLLGVISGAVKAEKPVRFKGLWGGRLLDGIRQPSDIEVDGSVTSYGPSSAGTDQGAQQKAQFSKTYDNEGLHRWDVSIGLQAKALKELQYNANDGTVRTSTVNRQNAFGLLDLYLMPVDLKGGGKGVEIPHFVLGLPLSGKPLDRPVVGLGIGINKFRVKFNLFAGAVFNKVSDPKTLPQGAKASSSQLASDLHDHRVTKLIFGVDIPGKQFTDALSKKK